MSYTLKQKSTKSQARLGTLKTNHGEVETPVFMPIATVGAIKTLGTDDVEKLGAQILLGNTYHLMLRPGHELVQSAGGLHKFMNWSHSILTDSGGYQVYSLAKLHKLTEEGVTFNSHIDGSKHFLSPEKSMEVQHALGSDIVMVLDECPEWPVEHEVATISLALTNRWAKRSKEYYQKIGGKGLLFGIQQGSTFRDLREESARALVEIGFDGYAVGGLSFEEPREESYAVVADFDKIIPENSARYFMGGAQPKEIVEYVKRGIDMFDCVLPTRNARHGSLYVAKPPLYHSREWYNEDFYETVHIGNEIYKNDFKPIDENCDCLACQRYTRAYTRHLFSINETLGLRLATLHNLYFYLNLMKQIRTAISAGNF